MQKIRKIFATQLFRVSWLNTVSVLIRIGGGVVAGKIVALFLGPSGMAVVGNFRNLLSGIDIVSTLGFQNGIIKYVAGNENDKNELNKIFSTVFVTIALVILILGIALYAGASVLNDIIFPGQDYIWIFKITAMSLPLYTGNLILLAVLNGLGKYRQVIYINILGNVLGVGISALLIWKSGINGALTGLIASPLLMFIFTYYSFSSRFGFSFFNFKNIDRGYFKGLLSYSLMSLLAAVCTPVVFISIRNKIAAMSGEDAAGYWEGMNRISVFYMLFASTILTVYYLPKLSASVSVNETKALFGSYYRFIVPVFAIGLIIIFLLRELIISIALSGEFLPMADLFLWQLLGDFLKVCGLILAFELIAKKMTKTFLIFEALSFISLYTLSNFMIPHYGAEGAVIAHTVNYTILLILFMVYFRKKLF